MSDLPELTQVSWLSSVDVPCWIRSGVAYGFEKTSFSEFTKFKSVKQVHGVTILSADGNLGEGDGIYSSSPSPVAVKTADCVPLLVRSTSSPLVAAIHCGWRGLFAGIINSLKVLVKERGDEVRALSTVVGPSICRECFEVGQDVVLSLRSQSAGLTISQQNLCLAKGRGDRWHIDLQLATVFCLLNIGVNPLHIHVVQICTRCDRSWHSHRREGSERTGSNWSWIASQA